VKIKRQIELQQEFLKLTEAMIQNDISDVRYHASKVETLAKLLQLESEVESD